jgi:hypothetical protein
MLPSEVVRRYCCATQVMTMNDDGSFALSRPSPMRPDRHSAADARERMSMLVPVLLALAAFAVYWRSAVILDGRSTTAMFGADSPHYEYLRQSMVNDRAARFHPLTIVLGLGWMKLLAPLTVWMTPAVLLNGMFAAIGAIGVWASTVTCAALLPRRVALLGGVLYAASLGVWYFSAIEESKIVTATLSVLYITAYVRLRERWTVAGAAGLSVILAMACLNEIVSAGLVAIPVVDAMARRGFEARREQWIVAHAMVVPTVWFFLEVFVNGRLIPESALAEGQSHFNMLLYYLAKNDYSLASIYSFILNWLFFNIAAPTPTAPLWAQFGGYFIPEFTNYFRSLPTIGVIASLAVIAVASVLPAYRGRDLGTAGALLLALAAYGLVRAAFFFFFNPAEPMLFSPAVTLVHWLILLVPFAASRFPAKGTVLSVLAICLVAANTGLILGRDVWALAAWR